MSALRLQVASVVQQYHPLEADLKTHGERSQEVQSVTTQQGVALKGLGYPVDTNVLDDKMRERRL